VSKTPWIKWYSGDFLNGVADLSPHEIALYTVILCRIYDEDRPIPHDTKKLARRCNMRLPQCEMALQSLLNEGKLTSDGTYIDNLRARKEREKRQQTSAKQSVNVTRRWQEGAKKTNKNNDGPIPPRSKNDTKPIPTRSQKLEPEKEVVKETTSSPPLPPHDVREMVKRWNDFATKHGLKAVQKITKARRGRADARLRDCGGMEGFDAALEKIRGSPGLLGDNDRGWKVHFDFVLSESNFTKIMEGNYDNWREKPSKISAHKAMYAAAARVATGGVDKSASRSAGKNGGSVPADEAGGGEVDRGIQGLPSSSR